MKIEKYGIVLHRLSSEYLELVRTWRNSHDVSQFMEYREYITADMQHKWFTKINNENNFYFLIETDGKFVGLVNLKDINYSEKTAESGIFIAESKYRATIFATIATIICIDFAFYELKLKQITAHILRDNLEAINYNKSLGMKLQANQENNYNQLYFLEKENYNLRIKKIRNFLENTYSKNITKL
jgi:UDP-4-amino-4,6-dideoxy-N-acetyl-beta-L-altrosamine N-acetyltransferase